MESNFRIMQGGAPVLMVCYVQPLHIRGEGEHETAPKPWIAKAAQLYLFTAVLNQNPHVSCFELRICLQMSLEYTGWTPWLVNSISLHQWAEKALDNVFWVVDLFDCIVAKWELFLQHRFLITEASMIQCLQNWLKLKVNYTADGLFWCIIENKF